MTDRELMQQALYYMDDNCGAYSDDYRKLIEALRARLAQPEPAPAAYLVWNRMGGISFRPSKPDASEYVEFDALYTAPPKPEWQGLTDEEVENFVQAVWPREAVPADYVRAIEAKLKEKNI